MLHNHPQWHLQAIAARKRDKELHRYEELQKTAKYFEANTNKSKYHEQWSTEAYYDKAIKDAESLAKQKIHLKKLEDRRKKLEMLLFKENMEYQQELKNMAAQPKFYKNGSYLNKVATSTLKEVNQGIIEKEEQLRRQEAELKSHHAWCMSQQELKAATSHLANGKLKSAWMRQIVEREIQKKKEEEELCKTLEERDEAIRKEIQIQQEKQKEKELRMKELRECLEEQISELGNKESAVKLLRLEEERDRLLLDQLELLSCERERELAKSAAGAGVNIVNMGLHKYRLKRKVAVVLEEIDLDLKILNKISMACMKDCESDITKQDYKCVLDDALRELEEHRDRERKRQKNIEAMFDGEARQINEKQCKIWKSERDRRDNLMQSVFSALRRKILDKFELTHTRQKENVLEREKILEKVENFHEEFKAKESERQLRGASSSAMAALQSQLDSLRFQKEACQVRAERERCEREERVRMAAIRTRLASAHRAGSAHWRA